MKYLQRLGLRRALFSLIQTNKRWPGALSRPYSASPGLSAARVYNNKRVASDTTVEPNTPKPQRFSRPTNEEIKANIIQLVNIMGQLELPIPKHHVLRTLRKTTDVLVELDPGGPDRNTVCKVMTLKELREQEHQKEKAARRAQHAQKSSTKQIELNWSIDAHDLSHRLKKLSSYVDKGRTVEIVLTKKPGKRDATEDEIKQLLHQVEVAIEQANARQSKERDGEPGKTLTITVQKA